MGFGPVENNPAHFGIWNIFLPFSAALITLLRDNVLAWRKIFIMHADKPVHTHSLDTHTRTLEVFIVLWSFQAVELALMKESAANISGIQPGTRSCGQAIFIAPSTPPLHLLPTPSPALFLCLPLPEQEPPVVPSITPLLSFPLPLFLSFLSELPLANWQIVFY